MELEHLCAPQDCLAEVLRVVVPVGYSMALGVLPAATYQKWYQLEEVVSRHEKGSGGPVQ